jgi:hypothetical protein
MNIISDLSDSGIREGDHAVAFLSSFLRIAGLNRACQGRG